MISRVIGTMDARSKVTLERENSNRCALVKADANALARALP